MGAGSFVSNPSMIQGGIPTGGKKIINWWLYRWICYHQQLLT